MTKVLVIQGAGFNMRGRTQIELFGSETMEQINDKIRGYAATLDIEVETFHSNIEGEVANTLYDAHDRDFDAAVINPAGFTTSASVLRKRHQPGRLPGHRGALHQPRGPRHTVQHSSRVQGLRLWLRGVRELPGPGGSQVSGRGQVRGREGAV